jgi:uncharacterized membrane protein
MILAYIHAQFIRDILFDIHFQHLLKDSYDVVKRWVNEAQEMVSSDSVMVQVWYFFLTV